MLQEHVERRQQEILDMQAISHISCFQTLFSRTSSRIVVGIWKYHDSMIMKERSIWEQGGQICGLQDQQPQI